MASLQTEPDQNAHRPDLEKTLRLRPPGVSERPHEAVDQLRQDVQKKTQLLQSLQKNQILEGISRFGKLEHDDLLPVRSRDGKVIEFRTTGKRSYKNVRKLAQGGYGITYEAFDTAMQIPVVIKVLAFLQSPDDPAAFDQERKMIASFSHPNIARIYQAGKVIDVDNSGKVVRRLCHVTRKYGSNLEDSIMLHQQTNPEQAQQKAKQFEGIVSAIQAVSEQGMTHRDIKPGNVCFDEEGRMVLLDFGLAFAENNRAKHTVMEDGYMYCTPQYTAPEYITGETIGDAQTDAFSLGCMLYEGFTGSKLVPEMAKTNSDDVFSWLLAYAQKSDLYNQHRKIMRQRLENNGVGPNITKLIMRLTRPDPVRYTPAKTREGKPALLKQTRIPHAGLLQSYQKAIQEDEKILKDQKKTQEG